ncbi:lysylphosphatidylglycerol synthase domain-containing protein [Luteimonas sp. RIT-PG2_3]
MTGKHTIAWVTTAAVVVMLAWLLRESWPEIAGIFNGARWYLAAASIVLLSLGNVQVGIVFAEIAARSSANRLQARPVVGVFLVSQVAKYVPGRIWGVVMQAAMLRSAGSTPALVAANVELSVVVLAVVSGVGLACLVAWEWGWLYAALVLLCTFGGSAVVLKLGAGAKFLLVASRFLPWVGRSVSAQYRLDGARQDADWSFNPIFLASLAAYIALYLLGWWLMVASISRFDAHDALAVVAAMSLSYIVGVMSMLPGGLGAREGMMLLLAPSVGWSHEDMAALALVSRAALLLVDAVTAAFGAWLLRRELF